MHIIILHISNAFLAWYKLRLSTSDYVYHRQKGNEDYAYKVNIDLNRIILSQSRMECILVFSISSELSSYSLFWSYFQCDMSDHFRVITLHFLYSFQLQLIVYYVDSSIILVVCEHLRNR